MVALKICVLVCRSTEQFPNKSVFIKRFFSSNNLQLMFFIMLRRVCLSSLYVFHHHLMLYSFLIDFSKVTFFHNNMGILGVDLDKID